MPTSPIVPARHLCALLDSIAMDKLRAERKIKVRNAKSRPENKRAGIRQVTPA